MEYESDILKRLINTYGVVGNPRYISEIIKEFIVQGKERFPELFTYQADWLAHIDEFGLNPTYTVSYTGQSIYAPNTLEKPIKSAILKGNTLVNIADVSTMAAYNGATILDGTIILDRSKHNSLVQITSANKLIQSGKKYIAILNEINGNTQGVILKVQHASYTESVDFVNNRAIFIADTYGGANRWVFVESTRLGSDVGTTTFKWSIIEYQEGMENWDIPYFTGMQSVKLPVLTSSNEDGTKTNILTVNEDVTLRSNGDICDELNLLTGQLTQRIGEDGVVLSQEVVKTVDLTILDQNGQNVKQLMSFNGGTHFNTGSLEGSLIPSVCVTVETDLEETLKVCSLEGNTM